MTCERVELANGVVAIVCSRGTRARRAPCCVCKRQSYAFLCDFPLRGKKLGRTCSAKICQACSTHVGPNRDFCPAHARLVGNAGAPPELLANPDPNAMLVLADLCEERGMFAPAPAPYHRRILSLEEWRELYEERAAIAEYHGGMSRTDAERFARELVGPQP